MYLDVHIAPHEVKIVPPSGPIECISEGNTEFIESKIQVYQLYRSFDEFLLLEILNFFGLWNLQVIV